MEESGLYTVVVAVVGTASVTVHAQDENEAMLVAEACVTPMHVHDWTYMGDEIEAYPHEQARAFELDADLDPA